MYEHMATVRSLDVVSLHTISPCTTMPITRDVFPNHSKYEVKGEIYFVLGQITLKICDSWS